MTNEVIVGLAAVCGVVACVWMICNAVLAAHMVHSQISIDREVSALDRLLKDGGITGIEHSDLREMVMEKYRERL